MPNNKFNSPSATGEEIEITKSLKLGLIAGLLTTVGDAIATYAAGVAIEESIEAGLEQNLKLKQQDERLSRIEKNIELIQKQLVDDKMNQNSYLLKQKDSFYLSYGFLII